MTEIEIIDKKLAKNGNEAFIKAKRQNIAYVAKNNGIFHVFSDGSEEKVKDLGKIYVKSKRKTFEI